MQKKRKRKKATTKSTGNYGPGKLTPAVQDKFLELYATGDITAAKAARKCGVTDVAIFKLKQRDDKFAARFLAAQRLSSDVMEDRMLARAINNRANNGHLTAMFGILRARNPAVWGGNSKLSVEHSGNVSLVGAFTDAMKEMPSGVGSSATH